MGRFLRRTRARCSREINRGEHAPFNNDQASWNRIRRGNPRCSFDWLCQRHRIRPVGRFPALGRQCVHAILRGSEISDVAGSLERRRVICPRGREGLIEPPSLD